MVLRRHAGGNNQGPYSCMKRPWPFSHRRRWAWTKRPRPLIAGDCLSFRLLGPTISHRVGQLEDELGGQLFDRSAYRPVLTGLGAGMLARAERLLLLADEIESHARNPDPLQGTLRIGAADSFAISHLPQLLTSLEHRHSLLDVDVTVNFSALIEKQLRDRELDLAFVTNPLRDRSVVVLPLYAIELVWAMAPRMIMTGLGSTVTIVGALAISALMNRRLARNAERDNPPAGRFQEVNRVRLHYVERGSGKPLVLLHGNGSMIQVFESSGCGLIDLAAKTYRVIVFDRPGFGQSDRRRNVVWTPAAQAELINSALHRLGVSDALVLGHSWGASVAVALALKYPKLVQRPSSCVRILLSDFAP
jgi:hypothetical protein